MARDLNKVQLTGRLGADPVLRYTAHGSPILSFRVATNRTWRSAGGQSHERTEWFRVIAWDQLAELHARQLSRGDHIYVEGRLQTRQTSGGDGPRLLVEVIASEIILLAERAGLSAAPSAEGPA